MIEVKIVVLVLDMWRLLKGLSGSLLSLCRWRDRCTAGGASQVVGGMPVDEAAEGWDEEGILDIGDIVQGCYFGIW